LLFSLWCGKKTCLLLPVIVASLRKFRQQPYPVIHKIVSMGFFDKLFGKKEKESLDEGLQKTKDNFLSKMSKAIAGKSTVDEEVLDNLEDALVSADVGIDTTVQIINRIEARVARDKYLDSRELNKILQQEIEATLVDAPSANSYAFDKTFLTSLILSWWWA
jgi:fused signal recognition particle receptor